MRRRAGFAVRFGGAAPQKLTATSRPAGSTLSSAAPRNRLYTTAEYPAKTMRQDGDVRRVARRQARRRRMTKNAVSGYRRRTASGTVVSRIAGAACFKTHPERRLLAANNAAGARWSDVATTWPRETDWTATTSSDAVSGRRGDDVSVRRHAAAAEPAARPTGRTPAPGSASARTGTGLRSLTSPLSPRARCRASAALCSRPAMRMTGCPGRAGCGTAIASGGRRPPRPRPAYGAAHGCSRANRQRDQALRQRRPARRGRRQPGARAG